MQIAISRPWASCLRSSVHVSARRGPSSVNAGACGACQADGGAGPQALASVVMTAEMPAMAAADLLRTAGLVLMPDPDGGYALRLGVRVLDNIGKIFPGLAVPSLPFVAGVEIRTSKPELAGQIHCAAGVAIRFIA